LIDCIQGIQAQMFINSTDNQNLRYREDHSASVVLSGCTL